MAYDFIFIFRKIANPANAPKIWAATKLRAPSGAIPQNELVNILATVTAGFAKDVDAVNQYAAAI